MNWVLPKSEFDCENEQRREILFDDRKNGNRIQNQKNSKKKSLRLGTEWAKTIYHFVSSADRVEDFIKTKLNKLKRDALKFDYGFFCQKRWIENDLHRRIYHTARRTE